jgi:acetyl esterase/lipase
MEPTVNPRPRSAEIEALTLNTDPAIAARLIRGGPGPAAGALLVFLHGGSFVDGAVERALPRARQLAGTGADVLLLGWPQAPAYPFPHSVNASFEALRWVATHGRALVGARPRLFVGGEEAGGNLAAALALMARDQHGPAIEGQVLIDPMLDPDLCSASARAAHAGPGHCPWAVGWREYLGHGGRAGWHAEHPYAVPLQAGRLAGLAPTWVLTTAGHPLRDDGLRYASRLAEAGVPVLLQGRSAADDESTGRWADSLARFLAPAAPPHTNPHPPLAAAHPRIPTLTAGA